ncbi:MAG TPA: hypothetical protein VJS91_06670 [Nitrososphaeraceae archaeon]|nr:hypothetical protein [Nitrososphaeraceae archaeon]
MDKFTQKYGLNIEKFSGRSLWVLCTLSLIAILILFISINVNPTAEAKYVFSKKWGTQGSGNSQFNAPSGIAIDSSGRLYVADTGNNRIQQFRLATPCPSGTTQVVNGVCFIRAWGSPGNGIGQFNKPVDIALDSSGFVYVADNGNNRIQMFRANGVFMKAWSSDGPGAAQFENIVGVALDTATNEIYVAEGGQKPGVGTIPGLIHKFQVNTSCLGGTTEVISGICFITKWRYGSSSSHPFHDIDSLSGLAVNPLTHQIYASEYLDVGQPVDEDFDRYSIIRSTADGNILNKWGGTFRNLTGLSIGPTGLVYVTDTMYSKIHMYQLIKPVSPCPAGTSKVIPGVCFVISWGHAGTADGLFAGPRDVTVGGSTTLVYVADTGNNRIQEFYWMTDVGGPGGGNLPGNTVK